MQRDKAGLPTEIKVPLSEGVMHGRIYLPAEIRRANIQAELISEHASGTSDNCLLSSSVDILVIVQSCSHQKALCSRVQLLGHFM